MAPRNSKAQRKEIRLPLGPEARYSAFDNIYAIFTDTVIHISDMSGRQTVARANGILKVKGDRDEAPPYDAIVAAQSAGESCKTFPIASFHIKLGGTGGLIGRHRNKNTLCVQCAMRALARSLDISCIEHITSVPSDCPRTKGGPRGRRM